MKGLGRRGNVPARPTPGRDAGGGRSLATVLVVLLLATVLLAAIATPVTAHAYLSDSDPENGEQLEELPDAVELTFSGDGIVTADVSVTDPDGEDVSGDAAIDPDDDQVVTVPIEADSGDGMYVVDWEVLADDGHTTTGSFFFVVGDEPLDRDAVVATFEADDDDDGALVEIVTKALLLVSLVGLVGVSAVAGLAVYPILAGPSSRTRERSIGPVDRRLRALLTGMAVLALISAAGLGVARGAHDLLGDTIGQVWLFQVVVGVVLVSILAVATFSGRSRRIWLPTAFLGGVVLTASMSWTSHSATAIDRIGGAAVDFTHVVGAGLWLGGLAVLALTVSAVHRRAALDERDAIAALVIRRYSVLAIAGVTLAAATGLILASWHVPNPGDLLGTTYGLALSIKTMLVVGAIALGGLTRFVLVGRLEARSDAVDGSSGSADGEEGQRSGDEGPGRSGDEEPRRPGGDESRRSGDDEPRPQIGDGGVDAPTESTRWIDRTIRLEVLVLVAVVLLSGLVTSVATPAVLGDDVEAVTIEGEGGDTVIELTAIPVSPDADDDLLLEEDEPVVFEVEFRGEDGPVASEGPVRLFGDHAVGDSSFEVALEETDDGTYATVQTLPATGPWDIRVSGSPDDAFVSDWFAATVAPDVAAHGDHDHGDDAAGDDESADDERSADDEVATGAETPADDEPSDDDDVHDHGGGDDVVSLADDRYPSVPIGDDGPGAFPALLQFGAILIAVGGTVVVTFEYLRAWNDE